MLATRMRMITNNDKGIYIHKLGKHYYPFTQGYVEGNAAYSLMADGFMFSGSSTVFDDPEYGYDYRSAKALYYFTGIKNLIPGKKYKLNIEFARNTYGPFTVQLQKSDGTAYYAQHFIQEGVLPKQIRSVEFTAPNISEYRLLVNYGSGINHTNLVELRFYKIWFEEVL